jgi:SAM-dependent methyltransferase
VSPGRQSPSSIRAAYDVSAQAWAAGPASAYRALADALVGASPTSLRGARVLDLGAGTGVAAVAASRAGASWLVGVDLADAMLRVGTGWDGRTVAAAEALPFREGSFDVVVAAFCLNHLPDPRAALLEVRRVATAILASAFVRGWTHPAKAIVDTVASRNGFAVPSWYAESKSAASDSVEDPTLLEAVARSAGFTRARVTTVDVDTGLTTPGQLTAWRLGMAHLAPFVASLDAESQARLRLDCEAALAFAPPLVVPMLVLAASG